MPFGFRLEGVDIVLDAIDKAEKRFDKAVLVAVNKGAEIVRKAAQANIHRRSGELKKHVKKRVWKREPGFVGMVVGPSFPGMTPQQRSYYGKWVEEGHRKSAPGKRLYRVAMEDLQKIGKHWRNKYGEGIVGVRDLEREELGSSRVPPHPWLRPALDYNKSRAEAEMAKVFRDATEGKIEESDAVAALQALITGE